MRKLAASVCLFATGIAAIQAQNAPGHVAGQTAKFWSVSASLRGFYDDNYNTAPDDLREESFGIEISPGIRLSYPGERTFAQLAYLYTGRYYSERDDDEWDHDHEVTGVVDHRFSERVRTEVRNSFIYSSQPELIEGGFGVGQATLLRSDASAFRNRASIQLEAALTRLFGVRFRYGNNYYDYEQDGTDSFSARLDRIEHSIDSALTYQWRQNIRLSGGYIFEIKDYTSDELITVGFNPLTQVPGSERDSMSHSIYVGADGRLSERFSYDGRLGVQITTYDAEFQDDQVSPFVDIGLNYQYSAAGRIRGSLSHARIATDVTVTEDNEAVSDQETTTAAISVNHRITPKLTVNGSLQYQLASYGESSITDHYVLAGLNFDYKFTRNLSGEVGYNFDILEGDSGRDYDRNKVYLGVRATY